MLGIRKGALPRSSMTIWNSPRSKDLSAAGVLEKGRLEWMAQTCLCLSHVQMRPITFWDFSLNTRQCRLTAVLL